MTIKNSIFLYNTATTIKNIVRGGVIHASSTNFKYDNVSFINNSIHTIVSTAQGGAIFCSGGSSSICLNCYFYNKSIEVNSEKFSGHTSFNLQGGSIYLSSMSLNFIECKIIHSLKAKN